MYYLGDWVMCPLLAALPQSLPFGTIIIILKMETERSSETLVVTYNSAQLKTHHSAHKVVKYWN
jgi:hypothetical protein